MARAARGPEDRPLPRVSNARAESLPSPTTRVIDSGRWCRFSTRSRHRGRDQPPDDATRQRLAVDGHRRLGARARSTAAAGCRGRRSAPAPGRRPLALKACRTPCRCRVSPNSLAMLEEQAAVGIEHVVGRRAPERIGHRRDALLAALRSRRTRRPASRRSRPSRPRARTLRDISRSGTRRAIPAPRECAARTAPSPTIVSSSSRSFMIDWLNRALERDPALAVLDAHAQHAAGGGATSRRRVSSSESSCSRRQSSGRGPGGHHGLPGDLDRIEPQLDFPFERRRHRHEAPLRAGVSQERTNEAPIIVRIGHSSFSERSGSAGPGLRLAAFRSGRPPQDPEQSASGFRVGKTGGLSASSS